MKKDNKVVLLALGVGLMGGGLGSCIVYYFFKIQGSIQGVNNFPSWIGSIADWVMVIVTFRAITAGFNQVKMQIFADTDSAKKDTRTFFTLELLSTFLKNDYVWSHPEENAESNKLNLKSEFSDSEALPVFTNVGDQVALNVRIVFTYKDEQQGGISEEVYERSYVSPGERVVILLPEWVKGHHSIWTGLLYVKLNYTTKRDERIYNRWSVLREKVNDTLVACFSKIVNVTSGKTGSEDKEIKKIGMTVFSIVDK